MKARRPSHRRCGLQQKWWQPDGPRALVRALSVRPVATRLWTARLPRRYRSARRHAPLWQKARDPPKIPLALWGPFHRSSPPTGPTPMNESRSSAAECWGALPGLSRSLFGPSPDFLIRQSPVCAIYAPKIRIRLLLVFVVAVYQISIQMLMVYRAA
jgi:hypothetical protein